MLTHDDADRLGRMARRRQHLERELTQPEPLGVPEHVDREVHLGTVAVRDRGARLVRQLEMAAQEVGVHVRLDDALDAQPVGAGVVEVQGDVASRIDDDRPARCFVTHEVRGLRQAVEVVLDEVHLVQSCLSSRSIASTLRCRAPLPAPGRWSILTTTLTLGARAATASTHRWMTSITSSHSPSTLVNIAFVSFGRPLSRTIRTASATTSPTESPTPSGVTENAASTVTSSRAQVSRSAIREVRAGGLVSFVLGGGRQRPLTPGAKTARRHDGGAFEGPVRRREPAPSLHGDCDLGEGFPAGGC